MVLLWVELWHSGGRRRRRKKREKKLTDMEILRRTEQGRHEEKTTWHGTHKKWIYLRVFIMKERDESEVWVGVGWHDTHNAKGWDFSGCVKCWMCFSSPFGCCLILNASSARSSYWWCWRRLNFNFLLPEEKPPMSLSSSSRTVEWEGRQKPSQRFCVCFPDGVSGDDGERPNEFFWFS